MTTTTRKTTTTARKKTTVARPATKVEKKVSTAAPVVKPVADVPVLRKKELIERVVLRSGIKKKDAKPTIEAMLAVLGEALASGEELNLQPLGKVMVKRVKEQPNAKIMVCRIRQRKAPVGSPVIKIAPKAV